MSTYDFRDEEPMWVRYAEFIGNGSDKFYEVRVDMADSGEFVITRRWGARPDTGVGQIKTETRQNDVQARGHATTYFAAKIAKGYRECDRPYGAGNKVAREYGHDYYADPEAF